MRVLVVAHQYWPTPGPASFRLGLLVKHLRGVGDEVVVITTSLDGARDSSVGQWGERVVAVPGERTSGASFQRAAAILRFAGEIVRWARSQPRFDLVVSDPPPTAAWAAMRVARQSRAAFVYYMSDCWSDSIADVKSPIALIATPFVRRLEKAVWSAADLVVTVSRRLVLSARDGGADDVLLAENGVDLERFSVDGEVWNPSGRDAPFFVYAGNFGELHGATIFMDAAKKLWSAGHEFSLVFMGYGVDEPVLQLAASQSGGRIVMAGQQPPENVAAALRAALAGLSSLRPINANRDARPIKALTYAAVGCPTLYVGEGDLAEEVSNRGLGLVSEYNQRAVEELMLRALSWQRDPQEYDTMRRRCSEHARANWDQDRNLSRVNQRIRELLGTRHRKSVS